MKEVVHGLKKDRVRRGAPLLKRWMYSHPPKASYGVASLRRTTAYCLQRRALSEAFGVWL
ncbi:hypothetical protein CHUV0807_0563 [Cardiobacterium hominis]|uniref:Uncharacterized protein n=1 Tax=Cardiobacterium hominis TaxID=2718 RepID=A0A1C3H2W3_9GAMM|nr:hypothetical protein CHUV0807_0563 [Cardiobacterium hominis]